MVTKTKFSVPKRFVPPLSTATLLALFVLLLFYRLLFTDRVLASGDILHYFYPYRDYASAALREGRIPLWNPYIFMGVPFLANPQSAVLYPLHWPLSWLPVTQQIYWSAAFHAWILAMGGYGLMRRWGTGWPAAMTTALVLAGSGFYGGLLGHINQMNSAAWLPWLLWALETTMTSAPTPQATSHRALRCTHSLLPLLPFSLFVTLSLLAGHAQTIYINLLGVGVWTVVRAIYLSTLHTSLATAVRHIASSLLIYVSGVLLGVLIAAAQLLPTLELSGLGLRSGGLSYGDMTSFSLRPLLLHWTLLPSYGFLDLSVVFATLGYTEFVAYVGLLGLLLALVGIWRGRTAVERNRSPRQYRWLCGTLFAGLGLFLALGRWNPFSFFFYELVPGFDLFRTPARWMMLYTLGMAILAGIGMECLRSVGGQWAVTNNSTSNRSLRFLQLPHSRYLLLPVLAIDLILAAHALPHTRPTAPQAVYDVRTAPAHLLTEPARTLHPAAMGRFLSMSKIAFDPGDMPEWHRVLRENDQISEAAFAEFIIALKSQEILAPNLSLFWHVPAVDGFDGGVLPLERYNAFLSLLIPAQELVPDGRIREQLQEIPPADILELMDVRFVITDKVRDLWFEGVYYDRQIGAVLTSDGLRRLTVENPHEFQATTVAIVGFVTVETEAAELARCTDRHNGGCTGNLPVVQVTAVACGQWPVNCTLPLGKLVVADQAGLHFADSKVDSPMGQGAAAPVTYWDVEDGQQQPSLIVRHTTPGSPEEAAQLVWLPLPEPTQLEALEISLTEAAGDMGLTVQAVTLIDERTDTFVPLLPSDRGHFRRVHSGDVKIYERFDVPDTGNFLHGRAHQFGDSSRVQLFGAVRPVTSPADAVKLLQMPGPEAIVEASLETVANWGLASSDAAQASLLSYAPERIVIHTYNQQPAFLVLKDAYYPGWQAMVNGTPAAIYAANVLFRGVPVPSGENEVVFSYQPYTWQTGLWVSMAGGVLWLLLALVTIYMNRARRNGNG